MNLPIDHLIYGVPDLDEGIKHIHELTGIRPVIGGSHPGLGTRNALLGLGNNIYLEIIAPDPEQQVDRQWMNLDQLKAPKLFRWAAASNELDLLRENALTSKIDIGEIRAGSRKTPQGRQLSWRLSDPDVILGDGVIPFFIDWGIDGNPTNTLPKGCAIKTFTIQHPNPERIQSQLISLGIEINISHGPTPALLAEINTPNGVVLLQ